MPTNVKPNYNIYHGNTDLTLWNILHGLMYYKLDVTCVSTGHE